MTGGGAGIGGGTARQLAAEGVHVLIADINLEAAERNAEAIRAAGGVAAALQADVSRAEDCERLVEHAAEHFGRLDILVNNAGGWRAGGFGGVDDARWQEDLDIKLFGAIRTIRHATPHLIEAGGGSISNIVGIQGKAPRAGGLPTSVSRAAGIALTKALSKELAPHNIRVNAVCLGMIKAGNSYREAHQPGRDPEAYYREVARERGIPLGRLGEPEEVGDLIAFLASHRGAYISGAAINLDGGWSPAT